jgi:hypothetical protein
MATPKTPVPTTSTTGITASSIAESGAGLIRLWVAALTLPITAATAIGNGLSRLITDATAALDGNSTAQSNNEIVKATSDLVKASTGLYTSLLNVAVSSLESLTKSINTAVANVTNELPRK